MKLEINQLIEKIYLFEFILFIISVLTFFGFNKSRKKSKENYNKGLESSIQMDNLLKQLEDELTSTGLENIPSISAITNGGENFKFGSPMFIRVTHCIYNEVLQLWGKEKTPLTTEIKKTLREVSDKGSSNLLIKKFSLEKLENWADVRSINRVHYFLIGYKRKITFLLTVNTESNKELTSQQKLIINTYADLFKDYMNSDLKWYQEHIYSNNL